MKTLIFIFFALMGIILLVNLVFAISNSIKRKRMRKLENPYFKSIDREIEYYSNRQKM